MSQTLDKKKSELLTTAYAGCETARQFQNVYTTYLGSQFKLLKLPLVLKKLQPLVDNQQKMSDIPTDEEIMTFAKTIEDIAVSTGSLKNKDFTGLEFIAMTYVFADHHE